MQISIVITTFNRVDDLNECLNSILNQTLLPIETIVIDNGINNITESIIERRMDEFKKKDIVLVYIKNTENSLTVARNIGSRNSSGEVILFLDDDVILDRDYIREIERLYRKFPQALGAQGYILREKRSKLKNMFNKIFFLFHLEKDKCKFLHSVSATYPFPLSRIMNCQWLSGSNFSFKRSVFETISFDEKLKKYSEGEDLDFSYRLFKKFPNSLYISPDAKLIHNASPAGRLPDAELIYMREFYGLYLFFKNSEQNINNVFIYSWSRVGKIISNMVNLISKLSFGEAKESLILINAYLKCIVHFNELRHGDLEFFNKTITSNCQL